MAVPYSASELLDVAREGNGQDVLDAVAAMTATHGTVLTALMVHSAARAVEADCFFAVADWEKPGPAMHWTPNDLEGAHP